MNFGPIFAVILGLALAIFSLSQSNFPLFSGTGSGPLATGPGTSAEVRNPQPVSTGGGFFSVGPQTGNQAEQPKPGESPYKGKVQIATVQRSGDLPAQEYVVVSRTGGFFGSSADQNQPIDVTGWTIGSLHGSAAIPQAFSIPEIDAAEQDIFLSPGGEVVIVTGTLGYTRNFRENQCVGYFSQTYSFTPSLSSSCPDSDVDRSDLLRRGFNGECIDAIDAVGTCHTPVGPFAAGYIGQSCLEYMNQNLNYIGCVKNFRDSKDFLGNTWRVELHQSAKLFNQRHDHVYLRDRAGLLVDEFEY